MFTLVRLDFLLFYSDTNEHKCGINVRHNVNVVWCKCRGEGKEFGLKMGKIENISMQVECMIFKTEKVKTEGPGI